MANSMVAVAKEGDIVGASIEKKLDGCHIVELDSAEEAILPNSHLFGSDKVDRYCDLKLGDEIRVRVIRVEPGKGFRRRVVVEEVAPEGSKERRK